MNLRICFKFKDCKLQFYEKRRLFSYFSVNPRTPASRWRRLLKLKRININSFKIIIGFFFTPPLFLATKVAISFVYYSPKTIKCTQKPKIEKKFTGIDQSSERASAILHIISITRSCACAQFTSSLMSLPSEVYVAIFASFRPDSHGTPVSISRDAGEEICTREPVGIRPGSPRG